MRKRKWQLPKMKKTLPTRQKKMIETMKAEIVAFLPGEEPELKKKLKCTYPSAHLICATFEEELDYLVHIKFEAVQNTQDKVFTITKITEEDREFRRLRQKRYTEKKQFEKLGFRNFWKEIIASGKPIVGHNFLQDTMFMMHTHETDLPPTYAEFKNQLHSTFNTIYDTKAIATFINSDSEQEPFPNTGLGSIYTAIRKSFDRSPRTIEEKFVLPPGFYNYNDASVGELSKAHKGQVRCVHDGHCFGTF
ncbi:poly(A)-specific ribonuclease [Angomonas deanei]|uniref:CAF1 family ribonuclease, putative n=1 Tax=Angomonas deanei TaxID=59799 RepID=A0A7G2C3G8_9TRYP|nr:poly(A)-specific ribonuclease [Angomonas deanei]CAD2213257.1 CAF1 family ribonuclease, putative [Angomonas deanei]|eukprot:EPY25832.1 poly(A)-specific ribonuclease [Angomonas deanei]